MLKNILWEQANEKNYLLSATAFYAITANA